MSVRDFDDTNTAFFRIVSSGAAYNLTVPFEADCIEWWDATKFGTNTNNISGVWFAGLPDAIGGGLITTRGTTTLTSTLETTNGVTELPDGSGFQNQVQTPTAITAANPGVVTINNHGWVTGNWVRASNFVTSPPGDATGMEQLNYKQFTITVLSANTFSLNNPFTGLPIDTTAFTAFVNNGVAKFTRIGQKLNTQNPAPIYRYTLGTAVMGAASDVIFVRATKGNQYTNLGQV